MPNRTFRPAFALAFTAIASCATAFDLLADRPLKIVQTVAANFPPTLALRGVTEGEVRAVLQVSPEGKLLDCLITAYTHEELAREVRDAVAEWTFDPPVQRGEAIGARTEVSFSFHARGIVTSMRSHEPAPTPLTPLIEQEPTTLLCRPAELDQPLRAVRMMSPRHPGKQVADPASDATVVLDFYIDADGVPRVPAVARASNDLYAAAAMAALMEWQFAPPTREGRPAVVRVTQSFVFAKRL